MASMNRQVTTPVKFPRSKRNHPVPVITSCDPGVCAPVAAIPMFREDAIVGRKNKKTMQWQSSRIQFAIEMKETKEIIVNKVRARVTAYCVPWLAMERFKGAREEFERSYAGEESLSGDGVVPFFESAAWPAVGTSEFYDTLGMHSTTGGNVNTMYLEAYNAIWNFRAKNRAKDIPLRTRLDDTLAPAFWPANRFEHLVPDFDEAVMDGQVALNVLYDQLPVRGIGFSSGSPTLDSGTIRHGDGLVDTLTGDRWVQGAGSNALVMDTTGAAPNVFPDIFAELQSNGISISLANIEMAKKAQKFAKLREQFTGHTDDWLIDNHLMNGLTLPDQAMKQPFLVADETVTFSQAGRYSTTAGQLDEKAVSGVAAVDIAIRVPRLATGGIVIVQVEILPDQMFERQKDAFLHTLNVDDLPAAMRDYADPEKVDIVTNGEIDTDHASPAGLFGYGPLNWKWNGAGPRIGGKFIKPASGGGTNVERTRFWAHEQADPALSTDFYVCPGITKSVFLDEEGHPFEMTGQGNIVLDGLTQFGGALVEATDNYEQVMAEMDQTRVKDA